MVLQIKTDSRNVNHLKQTHEGSHMFVRAYLRASTVDQDASRARDQLNAFAADRGDVLLIEQVDRLSRLTAAEQRVLADGRGVSESLPQPRKAAPI